MKYDNFCSDLLLWHQSIDRHMPWKNTLNPYEIWVSEIILQQTRVAQGTDYFHSFLYHFPTVHALAAATEPEVLKVWEGLGYYSRARNMHKAAKIITTTHQGQFPKTYDEIIALPGIGPYTTAAILSFAFDQPFAAIDGNVKRVLSRYTGYESPVNSAHAQRHFQNILSEMVPPQLIPRFNQAIMDLGALVCTPKKTKCPDCPILSTCTAYREQKVQSIPTQSAKAPVTNRYLHFLVCLINDRIILQRRDESNIWAGLYQLPLLETDKNSTLDTIRTLYHIPLGQSVAQLYSTKHKLTHQLLHITFYKTDYDICHNLDNNQTSLQRVKDLHKFAFPKPIKKFLTDHGYMFIH